MPVIDTTRGNAGRSTKSARRKARRDTRQALAPVTRSDAAQRTGARTPAPRVSPVRRPPATPTRQQRARAQRKAAATQRYYQRLSAQLKAEAPAVRQRRHAGERGHVISPGALQRAARVVPLPEPNLFGGPAFTKQLEEAEAKIERKRAKLPERPLPALPTLRRPTDKQVKKAAKLVQRSIVKQAGGHDVRKQVEVMDALMEDPRTRAKLKPLNRQTQKRRRESQRATARRVHGVFGPIDTLSTQRELTLAGRKLTQRQQAKAAPKKRKTTISSVISDALTVMTGVGKKSATGRRVPGATSTLLGGTTVSLPKLSPVGGQPARVTARRLAPLIWAADQASRPLYAVGAAAKKDVQEVGKHGISGLIGHGSLKAAGRGFTLKQRTTFSDVLKEAGIKNPWVAGVGGFLLDVGLDPTTYLTGGMTSAAKNAATRAAAEAGTKAATAALAGGATKAEAKLAARNAGREVLEARAAEVAAAPRGFQLRFGGARGARTKVTGGRRAAKLRDRHIGGHHGTGVEPETILREGLNRGGGNHGAGVYLSAKGDAKAAETYVSDGGYIYAVDTRKLKVENKGGEQIVRGGVPPEAIRLVPRTRVSLSSSNTTVPDLLPKGKIGRSLRAKFDSTSMDHTISLAEARVLHAVTAGAEDRATQSLHRNLDSWLKDWEKHGRPVRGLKAKTKPGHIPITPVRAAAKLGEKLPKREARQGVREGASELHGGVRPRDLTPEQWEVAQALDRNKRSLGETLSRAGAGRAHALSKLLRPSEYDTIIDAVEAGNIEALRGIAKPVRGARLIARKDRRQGVRDLARDPDRLYKLTKAWQNDDDALYKMAEDLGVDIGFVGRKPPVEIPEITADVAGARARVQTATKTLAAEERAIVTQAERSGRAIGRAERARPGQRTLENAERERGKLVELQAERVKGTPAVPVAERAIASARRQLKAAKTQHQRHVAQQALTKARADLKAARQVPGGRIVNRTAGGDRIRRARLERRAAETELGRVIAQARTERGAQARAQRLAAERDAEAKGYIARFNKERLEGKGGRVTSDEVQISTTGSTVTKTRGRTKPMAHYREADPTYAASISNDLPRIRQAYSRAMANAISHAQSSHSLVEAGRKLTPEFKAADLKPGERVYARDGARLRPLDAGNPDDVREITRALHGNGPADDYAVLPEAMVAHVQRPTKITDSKAIRLWDNAMGLWKGVALRTPAYLVRNAMSDAFAAYGAENPGRLIANYLRGQQSLNAASRAERNYKWFQDSMDKAGRGTYTTVNGEKMRYQDLALMAVVYGAIKQDRLSDVSSMLRESGTAWTKRPKGSGVWSTTAQRVEDSARMATFIGALERGATPEAAAQKVAQLHFDYGALTDIEKNARRVMPFYTFTSRNIPRQAQLAATRPGKLLAYEKARIESMKAFGIDEDYREGVDRYELRQMGIPVKVGGQLFTVSAALPFTDLNDLAPYNPRDLKSWAALPVTGIGQRGLEMLGPYKVFGELLLNKSAFYRDEIQKDSYPRVPVPSPVSKMADALGPKFRDEMGIKEIIDPKTGKLGWGWYAKLDYAVRNALPGPLGAALRMSYDKTNARGFGQTAETIGSLTGIRFKPHDPQQKARNVLSAEQKRLAELQTEESQAGRNLSTGKETRDYRQRQRALNDVADQIRRLDKGLRPFSNQNQRKKAATKPKAPAALDLNDLGGGSDVTELDLNDL